MQDLLPPKSPATVQRVNSQGLVEFVCIHTGRVLAVQHTVNDDFLHNRFENLIKIDTEDGPVYIERHLDPARVIRKRRTLLQFSTTWAEIIANDLLQPSPLGVSATLTSVCQKLDIPLPLVIAWRNKSEEFNEIIENALKAQAQALQDEALDTARATKEKDDVAAASLKVETLMKQAKVADSQRFGDKQKIDHTHKVAHTIVVETGIRRHKNPESLLPEGFEGAIRDATPIEDKREAPAASPQQDQGPDDKKWRHVEARAEGESSTSPPATTQYAQNIGEAKSILDIASAVTEDPMPLPLPDIENSGF